MPGIIDIAVNGARLIKKLSDELMETSDINIRYEYSPESFTGTEMDNAVEICQRVLRNSAQRPKTRSYSTFLQPLRAARRTVMPIR